MQTSLLTKPSASARLMSHRDRKPAPKGQIGNTMLEASKTHLNWILNQEDTVLSRTKSGKRTPFQRDLLVATIIEERVNKMLNQIDNDEQQGFLPSGSLKQARQELGYID